MKNIQPRIIEINIHRSRRNPKLGHAVALLFPCSHNKYLGYTLYKGGSDTDHYRASDCKILRIEDYAVSDKEYCKLCPSDDIWLNDLQSDKTLDDFVSTLESVDDL